MGRGEEAEVCYQSSIDSLEGSLTQSGTSENLNIVAHYAFHHGTALEELGRDSQAGAAYNRSIEIWEALREDGASQDLIVSLARALAALGRVKRKDKEFESALACYEKSQGYLLSVLVFVKPGPKREEMLKTLSGALFGGYKASMALRKYRQARKFRKALRKLLGQ